MCIWEIISGALGSQGREERNAYPPWQQGSNPAGTSGSLGKTCLQVILLVQWGARVLIFSSSLLLAEDDSRECELHDSSSMSHMWAQHILASGSLQMPLMPWGRLSAERIQGSKWDTKSIRSNTIVTANAEAHRELHSELSVACGKVWFIQRPVSIHSWRPEGVFQDSRIVGIS